MHQSTVPLPEKDKLPTFQQYQHQFVDYLRNPQEHKAIPETLPQQTHVYAKLLYSKFEGSLRTCFPITRKLLGSVFWQQLLQKFIGQHRCQSPLYQEIPDEFIDFMMNENPQMMLPDFIIDLAHYEWMELVLETEKSSQIDNYSPIKGNQLTVIPTLSPNLHLLHYRYPVQTITATDPHWKNWSIRHEPYPQEATILAGLRDQSYQIHFIELNAVTARLIELLQEQINTGEQALLQLAIEMNYGDPETILPSGINTLEQLKQQNIIIGARNE